MFRQRAPIWLLCSVWVWTSACHGCNQKTPVPFKRAAPDAGAAHKPDAGAAAAQASPEAVVYPDDTHQITIGERHIERGAALIHASLTRDLDRKQGSPRPDDQSEVMLLTSSESGDAMLELIGAGAALPMKQLPLKPAPIGSHCRMAAGKLSTLGSEPSELGLASVIFMCEAQPAAGPVTAAATPDGAAISPLDLPPPEPREAFTLTQHYIFTLSKSPQLQLKLSADWSADEPVSPDLQISSSDLDGDQLADVQVTFPVQGADAPEQAAPSLTLSWLSRSSGLAREQQQPESSLASWAQQATDMLAKQPKEAAALASETLALHRLLCRESGRARLWIDDARGISCGASAAAGRALATSAIAHARMQQLLPALDARVELQKSAVTLDKRTRDQVNKAIGSIRGDTGYNWYQGPMLRPASAPNLRLPALGFVDDSTLLLRGPVTLSFDLATRTLTPASAPAGLLATDVTRQYALTDIVRGCDGLHVRVAQASGVVGGVVTGAPVSEPLLLPEAGPEAANCTSNGRKRSERGGFELLGMNSEGALLAHGKHLWLLPLDARGNASAQARELKPTDRVAPLLTPGALDPSARFMALATTEGVALIDRAQDSARLIRTPASCAGGPVSDAVLSPSATKVAMLCSGRVYFAEPTVPIGTSARPTSEHP